MKLVCYGPWRGASVLWRPSPGAWALTVACHAVFELAPNESAVLGKAPALDPVAADDDRALVEPWGPPAPLKGSPEVVVVGHAHAPPGNQVTSLVARLEVGDLEKLIHVHGDGWLTRDGALSAPLPFSAMPLRWSRAAGGPHESNPAGIVMGKEAVADTQGRLLVPNLRPMGTWLTRRDDVFAPVGFGPIAPGWPSRVERLQHHAASWDAQRWADSPLPADFDASYFNVAPADQTLPTLAGDERIHLEHLHPRFPELTTHLAATPPCVVASLGGAEHNVPVACDTLVIDSDRGLAFLVWRGQIALSHPEQAGVVFVSPARLGDRGAGTLVGTLPVGAPALPFQRAAIAKTLPGAPLPTKPALPFRPTAKDAPSAETLLDTDIAGDDGDEDSEPPTLRRAALARLLASKGETLPPVVLAAKGDTLPPFALPSKGDTQPPPSMSSPSSVAASIEYCAAVAARLAFPGADRAAILEAEELWPATWEQEHARWLGEIQDELDRGHQQILQLVREQHPVTEDQIVEIIEHHQGLLVAYDSAYVAAIEEQRGPITAAEFVRLARAAEAGQAAPVLIALRLPEASTSRIQRVWRAKTANDPAAAAEVDAALAASET